MAESSKKQPRKSKLVPREYIDLDDDENVSSQMQSPDTIPAAVTTLLPKLKTAIDNESHLENPLSPVQFDIQVDVEAVYDDNICEDLDTEEIDNSALDEHKPPEEVIISEDAIRNEVEKLLQTKNYSNYIIGIEIRNSWGKDLVPHIPDHYEILIQQVLQEWKSWFVQSKIRTTILAYKCNICSVGWWHLRPFWDHIKVHKELSLRLETVNHESYVVAAKNEWYETMCLCHIEGNCPKCLKSYEEHITLRKGSPYYFCTACLERFTTCFALFIHEGVCVRYGKIIYQTNMGTDSMWRCDICEVKCLTQQRYDEHYSNYHSVRSDCPIIFPFVRQCVHCEMSYVQWHACRKKARSLKCKFCHRPFFNRMLLTMHMQNSKKDQYCKICKEYLPSQCGEILHLLKEHNTSYVYVNKCMECLDHVLLPTEVSLRKHRVKWHPKTANKNRVYSTRVLVPRSCLRSSWAEGVSVGDMVIKKPIRLRETEVDAVPAESLEEIIKRKKAESVVKARMEVMCNDLKNRMLKRASSKVGAKSSDDDYLDSKPSQSKKIDNDDLLNAHEGLKNDEDSNVSGFDDIKEEYDDVMVTDDDIMETQNSVDALLTGIAIKNEIKIEKQHWDNIVIIDSDNEDEGLLNIKIKKEGPEKSAARENNLQKSLYQKENEQERVCQEESTLENVCGKENTQESICREDNTEEKENHKDFKDSRRDETISKDNRDANKSPQEDVNLKKHLVQTSDDDIMETQNSVDALLASIGIKNDIEIVEPHWDQVVIIDSDNEDEDLLNIKIKKEVPEKCADREENPQKSLHQKENKQESVCKEESTLENVCQKEHTQEKENHEDARIDESILKDNRDANNTPQEDVNRTKHLLQANDDDIMETRNSVDALLASIDIKNEIEIIEPHWDQVVVIDSDNEDEELLNIKIKKEVPDPEDNVDQEENTQESLYQEEITQENVCQENNTQKIVCQENNTCQENNEYQDENKNREKDLTDALRDESILKREESNTPQKDMNQTKHFLQKNSNCNVDLGNNVSLTESVQDEVARVKVDLSIVKVEPESKYNDRNNAVENIDNSVKECRFENVDIKTDVIIKKEKEDYKRCNDVAESEVKKEQDACLKELSKVFDVKTDAKEIELSGISLSVDVNIKEELMDQDEYEEDIIMLYNNSTSFSVSETDTAENSQDNLTLDDSRDNSESDGSQEESGDAELNEEFSNKRRRRRNNTKMYTCKRCNFSGIHKAFREHKLTICLKKKHKHPWERGMKPTVQKWPEMPCSRCNTVYPSINTYVFHLQKKHGIKYGICPQCGHNFFDNSKLVPHLTSHVRHTFVRVQLLKASSFITSRIKGVFQCKVCQVEVEFKDFFSHWESHLRLPDEGDEEEDIKQFVIKKEPDEETSGQDFPTMLTKEITKTLLDQLVQTNVNRGGDKVCGFCQRTFTRCSDVKRHLIEHLILDARARAPPLVCQLCQHPSNMLDAYKSHMRTHAALPVYRCDICDKCFSDSSNFCKHQKTHNLEVMVCDVCKKKFKSKRMLESHMEMHRTSKPKTCDICQLIFHTESSYNKHLRARHERKYTKICQICKLGFPSLRLYWDHAWEVHKERRMVADCPYCRNKYRKFQDLRAHIRDEHEVSIP